MKRWRIRPASSLRGRVSVPGDKSIGHRALLLGSLAEGRSTIEGLSGGLDNQATALALGAMGVRIETVGTSAIIDGVGLHGLVAPSRSLDCGNSGTTMRLLAGLLVGQSFGSVLVGDRSLSKRPMKRIVDPLRARGARLEGATGPKAGEVYAPLTVSPLPEGARLQGLEARLDVPSAQVKSALLLSALYAEGPTAVAEPVLSRDHTERMLLALGVPLETVGPMTLLDPARWSGRMGAFDWSVPGDLSSAAFFIAAALVVPGSEIEMEGVGVNPTRTGLLDAVRRLGGRVDLVSKGARAGGEPVADLGCAHGSLRAAMLGGEMVVRMIDEIPALCAIAAVAEGRTDIRDARELRVKESDRIATMTSVLSAFGVDCTELDDGLSIVGGTALKGAVVRSEGDHRIAMAAAVLALRAEGPSVVEDVACVDTSFPGFAERLTTLGATIEVEP